MSEPKTALLLTYHRIINSYTVSDEYQLKFLTGIGLVHYLKYQNDRVRVIKIEEVDHEEARPSRWSRG
jgi:hypothetical protein